MIHYSFPRYFPKLHCDSFRAFIYKEKSIIHKKLKRIGQNNVGYQEDEA